MLKSTPEVLVMVGSASLMAHHVLIEDKAIELRRTRRVKLPDALIAATALCNGLNLLTMDLGLQAVMHSAA